MANILITNYCNNNCSYCFAKEKVSLHDLAPVDTKQTMSLGDYGRVLQWLKKSRAVKSDVVKLLGGEPTLHPQFIEFVSLALDEGFTVQVFSNGMIPAQHLERLESVLIDKVKFLLNTNERQHYSANKLEAMEQTWALLGQRASLGFNIVSPDFDLSFHEEIILRHDLHRSLRLGLAVPLIGKRNQHLPREEYRQTGSRIVEWARRLEKNDILLSLDCGFTMCMFTPEEHGELTLKTRGFKSICQPIIDVGTDLSVWSCFPLSTALTFHLDDGLSLEEMIDRFEQAYRPFKQMGIHPECMGCEYLAREQCRGGCLGYTLTDFATGGDAHFLERFKRSNVSLGKSC